jgi:hypothetical protein
LDLFGAEAERAVARGYSAASRRAL